MDLGFWCGSGMGVGGCDGGVVGMVYLVTMVVDYYKYRSFLAHGRPARVSSSGF